VIRSGRHFLQRDGRSVVPVGAHVVPREGPDWPWRVGSAPFAQAFAEMAALGLDVARIDVLWEAVEPDEGRYDERHLRVLDEILEAARRHGVLLHPALLIGGEVGDAFWDVPWRAGRHPHADPEMRALQARHVAGLAARWRGDPALLGWDLTDEPPFWPFEDTTDADARAWTAELAAALREHDPEHLITIGTASQEVGGGPFRADVVADLLDFACVHPYPIFSPGYYPDGLLDVRMTHAAAFETALAAGAGRPVMVHEFGASSAQYDPERIAAYDRLQCWSSFGRGAIGFVAWCWIDAEPAAARRAPYVRTPIELQFGLIDARGHARPRASALAELAAGLRAIDLDAYAADGPAPRAAIVVPREYATPYDPAGYGLENDAGTYLPVEQVRNPRPDVGPLVQGWLNAFVLASRAGLATSFASERLDAQWPALRLLLAPAPVTTTLTSMWHARTSFWDGAPAFHAQGGTLYLSLSAESGIPEMDALAGCRIADRAPASDHCVLRFVERWGALGPGDELTLPAAPGELGTRGVRLTLGDGRVAAVDQHGEPALVVAERGAGRTVTCAQPVELLLARLPDAHRLHGGWTALYQGLADLADAREDAWAAHPDVTSGVLHGERGGLVVLTNHGDSEVATDVTLPTGAEGVTLPPHGATTLAWDA
jgi:cellulase (glycosyl hydrolase family 5)